MRQHLLQKLGNDWQIAAIMGISKNAGKTTFLNWLVEKYVQTTLGIITTGRDGEDFDLVGGHTKPKVKVPTGSFYSTGEKVIIRQANSLEVISKLPYVAGGQRLWLVRALEDIYSEIIGPATASDQIELAKFIISQGAKHVFIDGSLDRKSVALSPDVDAILLVAGATAGNLEFLNQEIARLSLLSEIPQTNITLTNPEKISYKIAGEIHISDYSSVLNQERNILSLPRIPEAEWVYFPKAFTARNLEILGSALQKPKFIFRHPLHLQLTYEQLSHIASKISVMNKIKIDAIALNSYSVKGNHLDCEVLRAEIRQGFPRIPVIDISEIG